MPKALRARRSTLPGHRSTGDIGGTMSIDDILRALELRTDSFPPEVAAAAVAQREALAPRLLAVLGNVLDDPGKFAANPDCFLHVHALLLLAQFREKAAFPSVVGIASLPDEVFDGLFGGDPTTLFGRVLASVYGGNPKPIERLVEDRAANEWARAAGVQALVILARAGLVPMADVQKYFKALFQGRLELTESCVWTELALAVGALPAPDLFEDLRRAYEAELVDPSVVGLDEIASDLHEGPGPAHDAVFAGYRLVGDVALELREAAEAEAEGEDGFEDDDDDAFGDDDEGGGEWAGDKEASGPVAAAAKVPAGPAGAPGPNPAGQPPFIALNKPCPCGSRRKYKKCCGAPGAAAK